MDWGSASFSYRSRVRLSHKGLAGMWSDIEGTDLAHGSERRSGTPKVTPKMGQKAGYPL